MCCCFRQCFEKSTFIRRQISKHRKFELALERLSDEQDIQAIIESNRIARLIHKATFLARQRTAINFGHKYIITDKAV